VKDAAHAREGHAREEVGEIEVHHHVAAEVLARVGHGGAAAHEAVRRGLERGLREDVAQDPLLRALHVRERRGEHALAAAALLHDELVVVDDARRRLVEAEPAQLPDGEREAARDLGGRGQRRQAEAREARERPDHGRAYPRRRRADNPADGRLSPARRGAGRAPR
jgi:hypothetical protein